MKYEVQGHQDQDCHLHFGEFRALDNQTIAQKVRMNKAGKTMQPGVVCIMLISWFSSTMGIA